MPQKTTTVNTTANNAANNAAETNRSYDNIIAKVVKVMIPKDNPERVTLVLNKSFITIDFDTAEEKETNNVGFNIYALTSQVGVSVPEIQLADTLAMGKMVNPQIIALAMVNADVEIERKFHQKGEKRETTNDVYGGDCIVSKLVNVKTHIQPIFSQMLGQLIATAPAIVQQTAMPNPFGV